jgi:hypothetical protein
MEDDSRRGGVDSRRGRTIRMGDGAGPARRTHVRRREPARRADRHRSVRAGRARGDRRRARDRRVPFARRPLRTHHARGVAPAATRTFSRSGRRIRRIAGPARAKSALVERRPVRWARGNEPVARRPGHRRDAERRRRAGALAAGNADGARHRDNRPVHARDRRGDVGGDLGRRPTNRSAASLSGGSAVHAAVCQRARRNHTPAGERDRRGGRDHAWSKCRPRIRSPCATFRFRPLLAKRASPFA